MATAIIMTPPNAHVAWDALLSAGAFRTRVVGSPGAHGEMLDGMQGIGVRTPRAAAVAPATCGFAMLLHMPNGLMFAMGLLSMMFAGHCAAGFVGLSGTVTISSLVPRPIEHVNIEPLHTGMEISPG